MSECVASSAAGAFDRDRDRDDDDDDSSSRRSQLQRAFASTTGIVGGGSGHPVNEVRVEKLREELLRWRTERQRVLAKSRAKRGSSITAADSARS